MTTSRTVWTRTATGSTGARYALIAALSAFKATKAIITVVLIATPVGTSHHPVSAVHTAVPSIKLPLPCLHYNTTASLHALGVLI